MQDLQQVAKDWFYDKCHGYPEDIIASLYELLTEVSSND